LTVPSHTEKHTMHSIPHRANNTHPRYLLRPQLLTR
jgi:hypothetical protein